MKFVATKTAEQLDLQALHRVRERLVSQRTGVHCDISLPCIRDIGRIVFSGANNFDEGRRQSSLMVFVTMFFLS